VDFLLYTAHLAALVLWRSDVVRGAIELNGLGGTNASDVAADDTAMMHEKGSFMVAATPYLAEGEK
jgi:hypothetical protein